MTGRTPNFAKVLLVVVGIFGCRWIVSETRVW